MEGNWIKYLDKQDVDSDIIDSDVYYNDIDLTRYGNKDYRFFWYSKILDKWCISKYLGHSIKLTFYYYLYYDEFIEENLRSEEMIFKMLPFTFNDKAIFIHTKEMEYEYAWYILNVEYKNIANYFFRKQEDNSLVNINEHLVNYADANANYTLIFYDGDKWVVTSNDKYILNKFINQNNSEQYINTQIYKEIEVDKHNICEFQDEYGSLHYTVEFYKDKIEVNNDEVKKENIYDCDIFSSNKLISEDWNFNRYNLTGIILTEGYKNTKQILRLFESVGTIYENRLYLQKVKTEFIIEDNYLLSDNKLGKYNNIEIGFRKYQVKDKDEIFYEVNRYQFSRRVYEADNIDYTNPTLLSDYNKLIFRIATVGLQNFVCIRLDGDILQRDLKYGVPAGIIYSSLDYHQDYWINETGNIYGLYKYRGEDDHRLNFELEKEYEYCDGINIPDLVNKMQKCIRYIGEYNINVKEFDNSLIEFMCNFIEVFINKFRLYQFYPYINFIRNIKIKNNEPVMGLFVIIYKLLSYMIYTHISIFDNDEFYGIIHNTLNYCDINGYKNMCYIDKDELPKYIKILNYDFSNVCDNNIYEILDYSYDFLNDDKINKIKKVMNNILDFVNNNCKLMIDDIDVSVLKYRKYRKYSYNLEGIVVKDKDGNIYQHENKDILYDFDKIVGSVTEHDTIDKVIFSTSSTFCPDKYYSYNSVLYKDKKTIKIIDGGWLYESVDYDYYYDKFLNEYINKLNNTKNKIITPYNVKNISANYGWMQNNNQYFIKININYEYRVFQGAGLISSDKPFPNFSIYEYIDNYVICNIFNKTKKINLYKLKEYEYYKREWRYYYMDGGQLKVDEHLDENTIENKREDIQLNRMFIINPCEYKSLIDVVYEEYETYLSNQRNLLNIFKNNLSYIVNKITYTHRYEDILIKGNKELIYFITIEDYE